MQRLARDERFEEAAATRDRLAALARALDRRRTVAMWRGVARLVVECEGQRVEIRRGLVVWPDDESSFDAGTVVGAESGRQERAAGADVSEILAVDRWVARTAGALQIAVVDGELSSSFPRIFVAPTVRSADSPIR